MRDIGATFPSVWEDEKLSGFARVTPTTTFDALLFVKETHEVNVLR